MTLHALPESPKAPSAAKTWQRALALTAGIEKTPARIFPLVVEELGTRFADSPALLSPDETWSHAALAARARGYARWGLAQGIRKGQCVALLMPNRPDYLAIWLGLSRIGAVVALINTHLTGAALAHCLDVAAPSHVIVDGNLAAALTGIRSEARMWRHDDAFLHHVAALPGVKLDSDRNVTLADPALLIYTSGTTGFPKAAYVSHLRVMLWTHWFAGLMDAQPSDRLYNCLPMYHSVGGVVASGAVLVAGGAVICREKFSAGRFWEDVEQSGATIFQYIGELCRYLLQAPGRSRHHALRLACGNGLSADVWTAFQDRFAIPRILEFYAATEGNFSLFNVEGRPGAIGRIPGFLGQRGNVALIARDAEGEPVRGTDGFCRRVLTGEAGEAIGRIGGGAARFEGYSDKEATAKKILRDVFAAGDAWMRTGDLMRQDAQGFFYFVDRLGDTFRWKGENVATSEVAAALRAYPGIADATVYGVAVPGRDGRAGMAAVQVDAGFDLAGLKAHLKASLPDYARPVFLRQVPDLAMTETFKQKKQSLMADGFDPARIQDPLYADLGGGYVPLDPALYALISTGRPRI